MFFLCLRLKKNSTVLCHDRVVDEVTEDFFNHQLQHLHCSCAAITSDTADEGELCIPEITPRYTVIMLYVTSLMCTLCKIVVT